MKNRLILLLCILFPLSVFAAPENTPPVIPDELHIYSESGSTYVDLAPAGCSEKRYYIPESHPKYDAIVSILLAAQLANREVQGRFDGCNSSGKGRLIGVYLK